VKLTPSDYTSLNSRPSGSWRWREGHVNRRASHFELRYGSHDNGAWADWVPIALIGPPKTHVFTVQFLVEKTFRTRESAIMANVMDELNFYLVTKGERDPWGYARYHCSTMSNVYSSVHWSFFPGRPHGRGRNRPE
jgi:hypothetical protein